MPIMDQHKSIIIGLLILITILRYIVNNIIYRVEYEYDEYTDGVAVSFDEEEVRKRDNAVVLFFLSLFTLYWFKWTKKKTEKG